MLLSLGNPISQKHTSEPRSKLHFPSETRIRIVSTEPKKGVSDRLFSERSSNQEILNGGSAIPVNLGKTKNFGIVW